MKREELFEQFRKMTESAGYKFEQISHDAFAVRPHPTRKPLFVDESARWDRWKQVGE